MTFPTRKPDLVAFHPGKNVWRFCEVKGRTDRCSGDHFCNQLKTLAVLHLLTGACVAVVRTGFNLRDPTLHPVEITYSDEGAPDWAR